MAIKPFNSRPASNILCNKSYKVTDFGTNRKPICDFLLVINTNSHPIMHSFPSYCAEYLIRYCSVYSPSKMQRHVWSLESKDVITLRRSCTIYTGYLCDSEWRSSLLFWCTRQ